MPSLSPENHLRQTTDIVMNMKRKALEQNGFDGM